MAYLTRKDQNQLYRTGEPLKIYPCTIARRLQGEPGTHTRLNELGHTETKLQKTDSSTATDYCYQNSADILQRVIQTPKVQPRVSMRIQKPPRESQMVKQLKHESLMTLSTDSIENDSVLGKDRTLEKKDLIECCQRLIQRIRLSNLETDRRVNLEIKNAEELETNDQLKSELEKMKGFMQKGESLLSDADTELAALRHPVLDVETRADYERLKLEQVIKKSKIQAAEDKRDQLTERHITLETDLKTIKSNSEIYSDKEGELQKTYARKHTEFVSLTEREEETINEETIRETEDIIKKHQSKLQKENRIISAEKSRLQAAIATYKAAQNKQEETNRIFMEEELAKREQIQDIKRQIKRERDELDKKLAPDRLAIISDEREALEKQETEKEESRRSVLNELDKQLNRAQTTEIKVDSYISKENELHNLNLKIAEIESEKREIKWKCHQVKARIAEIENWDHNGVLPDERREILRARSIKDPSATTW